LTGRILVAGNFLSFNGTLLGRIAQLLPNGRVDTTFDPGHGANGPIRAMALQPDGRIVIVGLFNQYNDVDRSGIARLNPDGSLDNTFDAGAGADGVLSAVALLGSGPGAQSILVGGDFLTFGGQFAGRMARLRPDGSFDSAFDIGVGFDQEVRAIVV